MEYDVLVRARYMAPKRDPQTMEVHAAWRDDENTVRVDIPDSVPRDLQADRARSMAIEKLQATLLGRSVRYSIHCTTPVTVGDGNIGNPNEMTAGRMPMRGRRGDWAKTAPRANGRFAKAG